MRRLRIVGLPLAVLGLLWAAPAAFADPVEPGPWTEDSPSYNVQTCSGGEVDGMTFTLPGSSSSNSSGLSAHDACGNGKPRAELRYDTYANDGTNYSTGVRQFEGTFTINSISGSRISLKQTFNGSSGPYFLMAVENTGRLYSVEGGTTISDGIAQVGNPVQVNTVHDTNSQALRVYINGSLAYEDDNAPSGEFYDKIGAYTTSSGWGGINVTWSNVHFWHQ